MDTSRAREVLGWQSVHNAMATLRATVAGAKEAGIRDGHGARQHLTGRPNRDEDRHAVRGKSHPSPHNMPRPAPPSSAATKSGLQALMGGEVSG